MKLFIAILLSLNSFAVIGQELNGTWLYDNQRSFISKNDRFVTSDIFDFFGDYSITNDTLKIKHQYPERECTTTENGQTIVIPCYDSIPNSWFKITQRTSDSLYLNPINRSAIAISARLKNRFWDQSKLIISDSSYMPDYFKTIKLYNSNTLIEKINWSKIRVSWKTKGWHQEFYNYLEIDHDGTFKVFKKTSSYKKEDESALHYYKGTLTETQRHQLKKDVNTSSFFHFEIDDIGLSTHGALIKIQVVTDTKRKTHMGYRYKYPTLASPLLKMLLSIVHQETNKQQVKPFKIPSKFKK
ncbi:hypothetical protein [uncultured Dokdonia sp.]|uniref:hypothetical protein n=1 Tax=uncultured Dokdonia sp. TaxID=575653 RepID=UPI0026310AA7|nr:hypothetical protein [uncultured Dokdonia sp.]